MMPLPMPRPLPRKTKAEMLAQDIFAGVVLFGMYATCMALPVAMFWFLCHPDQLLSGVLTLLAAVILFLWAIGFWGWFVLVVVIFGIIPSICIRSED